MTLLLGVFIFAYLLVGVVLMVASSALSSTSFQLSVIKRFLMVVFWPLQMFFGFFTKGEGP